MTRAGWVPFVLLFSGLVLACSSSSSGDDGGVDSGVDAAGDPGADRAADGDGGGDPGGGDGCTPQDFTISQTTSRIMILLDQSHSMSETVPWFPNRTRWREVGLLLQLLCMIERNRAHEIGLDAFPDGDLQYLEACYDQCCADPVCWADQPALCQGLAAQCDRVCSVDLAPVVPLTPAETAAMLIDDYMYRSYVPPIFSQTPLVAQLQYYAADRSAEMPGLYAGDGSGYLILISDGIDTCFDQSDPPDIPLVTTELGNVTREILETRGIKTFVIGIGSTTGDAASELFAVAHAGGTRQNSFFAINQYEDLVPAVSSISAEITSCFFNVEEPEEVTEPERVRVYFDSVLVDYDETCSDGWRWSSESTPQDPQIEFCGPACNRLRGSLGTVIRVRSECID